MNWPTNHLLIVLVVALAGVAIPWMMPRAWCRYILPPLVVPMAAALLWLQYEQHIDAIARVGDPLIRIDLFLIIPLIAAAWFSAAVSIALAQFPKQNTAS